MKHSAALLSAALLAFGMFAGGSAQAIERGKPVHGLALYGAPKYPADFKHFDYVNPDAPKGGTFVKSNEAFLTFDTFNPYTLKGAAAYGTTVLLHDTLMMAAQDEPASVYGLVAQTVEVAPDGSWVEFVLRPEARFSDNSPITAADVVYSFNILLTKATPQFRIIYADVAKAEATAERTVRFTLKSTTNRKMPLLLGELPVLSEAFWKTRDFAETTLDIPVVSGPYNIATFEVGRYVLYKRLENYWGKDLAATRGMYNFDNVRYEYFRDDDVQFEAFKTNTYDFIREMSARQWATAYEFPAIRDGRVKKMLVSSILPRDVSTLVLNLRRPLFQDRRVREAINLAFDFNSINKNLMYDAYGRLRSYWQGSPLEAKGLPSDAEIKLLEPFRDKLPPELFTTEFQQPTTEGNGNNRDNLLKAQQLLKEAGWDVKDGRLVNAKGQPFAFEVTLVQAGLERVMTPWLQDLKRLGIEATLRVVDTSQYANRVNSFDYDSIYIGVTTSLTPGNELENDWGSVAADSEGSTNYSGVKDPVVDALIAHIIKSDNYEDVTTATRALDRVLTFNHYRALTYTADAERIAVWSKLSMPEKFPALGLGRMGESAIALWWAAPAQAAAPAPTTETPADSGSPNLWIFVALAGVAVLAFIFYRRRRA